MLLLDRSRALAVEVSDVVQVGAQGQPGLQLTGPRLDTLTSIVTHLRGLEATLQFQARWEFIT